MGARAERRAFRKGFVLGALAAAGAVVWNAPQPGWRTREQIMEIVEGVLFRVLDFPQTMSGLRASAATAAPPPTDALASERPSMNGSPAAPSFGVPDAGIGERDIVIDGPRPSELAR